MSVCVCVNEGVLWPVTVDENEISNLSCMIIYKIYQKTGIKFENWFSHFKIKQNFIFDMSLGIWLMTLHFHTPKTNYFSFRIHLNNFECFDQNPFFLFFHFPFSLITCFDATQNGHRIGYRFKRNRINPNLSTFANPFVFLFFFFLFVLCKCTPSYQ